MLQLVVNRKGICWDVIDSLGGPEPIYQVKVGEDGLFYIVSKKPEVEKIVFEAFREVRLWAENYRRN